MVDESLIARDEKGRPIIRCCPLCGAERPGGIWGDETTAATSCRNCDANVLIDIGPETPDDYP